MNVLPLAAAQEMAKMVLSIDFPDTFPDYKNLLVEFNYFLENAEIFRISLPPEHSTARSLFRFEDEDLYEWHDITGPYIFIGDKDKLRPIGFIRVRNRDERDTGLIRAQRVGEAHLYLGQGSLFGFGGTRNLLRENRQKAKRFLEAEQRRYRDVHPYVEHGVFSVSGESEV